MFSNNHALHFTCLGIAQSALDATIAYTKERIQFGKPIAANQGIQWVLVDMATRVDCARMLVYRAAAEHHNLH